MLPRGCAGVGIQSQEPTGNPPGAHREPSGPRSQPGRDPRPSAASEGARASPHGNGAAARQGALSAAASPLCPLSPGLIPAPSPGPGPPA